MQFLSLPCPHCETPNSSFRPRSHYEMPGTYDTVVTLSCGSCAKSIGLRCNTTLTADWLGDRVSSDDFQIIEAWPDFTEDKAPANVPKNVESFFLQGLDCLRRRSYDAAGTMFRKSVEAALKSLHPEGKGMLYERIEKLPAAIGVTPAMSVWAHRVRVLGGGAAHDEAPLEAADAEDSREFAELFLTYAFTLPARIPHLESPD